MRFSGVHIPYHTGNDYGTNYVYLSFPSFLSRHFAEAGRAKRSTIVNEKSLVPDEQRW